MPDIQLFIDDNSSLIYTSNLGFGKDDQRVEYYLEPLVWRVFSFTIFWNICYKWLTIKENNS